MSLKLTLTIASVLGSIFALAFYIAPEFVTRQQFPTAEGEGFHHLVTLRYALGSLVACIVIITFQLRNIEGADHQKSIMLGYGIGFFLIFLYKFNSSNKWQNQRYPSYCSNRFNFNFVIIFMVES